MNPLGSWFQIGDYVILFYPVFENYKVNIVIEKLSPYGDNLNRPVYKVNNLN